MNMENKSSQEKNNRPEFDFYDDGWHEDVWQDQKTLKYKFAAVVKIAVVLVVLGGLIYLSGIYQGTLFRKTSRQSQPQHLSCLIEGETENLALSVINVVDKKRQEEVKTKKEIKDLTAKASVIWDQARINLELSNYTVLKIEEQQMSDILSSPYSLLKRLPKENKQGVVVFLVHSLHGINGIAFVGEQTVAVAEFTTIYDFRVLAHEVGHILGLSHVKDSDMLMSTDAGGAKLTKQEAEKARQTLKDFFIQ